MTQQRLAYDRMLQNAFRGVVREALVEVAENGLPGEHHFYITFRTDYPGVSLSPFLVQQYPKTMTIVLRYQFADLSVKQDSFFVSLWFNRKHESLTIPFLALVSFSDPFEKFDLHFEPEFPVTLEPNPARKKTSEALPSILSNSEPSDTKSSDLNDKDESKTEDTGVKVINLDAFRKK